MQAPNARAKMLEYFAQTEHMTSSFSNSGGGGQLRQVSSLRTSMFKWLFSLCTTGCAQFSPQPHLLPLTLFSYNECIVVVRNLFMRVDRDLRLSFSLDSPPTNGVAIEPTYPASVLANGAHAVAQYVRIYVSSHHDNQGYFFDLHACPASHTGE